MPVLPRPQGLMVTPPGRIEFALTEFNSLILSQGRDVTWYKAQYCPNRLVDQEDHHVLQCSLCKGSGFIYRDPISTKMLVTSVSQDQRFQSEGLIQPGTSYFTPTSDHVLSFFDKLVLTSQSRYSEIVKISAAGAITTRYPVVSVQHVLNNAGTTFTTFSIANGVVTFSALPAGTNFISISYMYHTQYIVNNFLHLTRDFRGQAVSGDIQQRFPQQAVAQLEFLVIR